MDDHQGLSGFSRILQYPGHFGFGFRCFIRCSIGTVRGRARERVESFGIRAESGGTSLKRLDLMQVETSQILCSCKPSRNLRIEHLSLLRDAVDVSRRDD